MRPPLLLLRKFIGQAQLRTRFWPCVWALWLAASAVDLRTWAAATASAYVYDVWPVEEGWMPTAVTSIIQSRDGYLWLGTYQGLMRYDGVRFTFFDSTHTPGLQNSRITALYQEHSGRIWIGHETGELTQFQDRMFSPANPGQGWPGGAIETITTDANDDVWVVNDAGTLFRLRDGLAVASPGGASPSRKLALSRAKGGRLWLVSNGMVSTLEGGKAAGFQFPDASPTDFYERVAGAQDDGLWVLRNGRIRKWERDRWTLDLGEFPWGDGSVTALLETRAGALLVGTLHSGLYMVTPGAETLHFSRTNGLLQDWVRSLCEDHEGNIWIGTGAGLNTLRPRKVKMLDSPDHWQGRMVLSIAAESDDSAWIGTEGAGLYHYDKGNWTSYVQSSGLSNLFVWSVLITRQGELYAGTWGGGLAVKRGEHFESPGDLAKITAPVVALYEGQAGEVWAGTTLGVYRCEATKLTWFAGKEKLSMPDVRAIAQSPDGTLWFGMSGGGLAKLKDGVLKQFRKQDGLSSDFVLSLYAEADGSLWIGTSDSGLGRWKEGKFAAIGTDQGLASMMISQIADDGAGNFWLGSNRGILRIAKTALQACADGTVKTVQCFSYGKAEGLASLNCLGRFQPGARKTPQGLLWFPTAKGVATLDPMKVVSNPVPPPVVIEALVVDGQPIDMRRLRVPPSPAKSEPALQIPPGEHRFEMHYTGLSFAAPDKVCFQYKLEGLEHEWLEAGTERSVQYSYLPPGTYTFQVIACNNDAVWNRPGASLSFTVLPQFWQTWWFRAVSVVAGAGAVAATVAWVMRRRGRRKLEALERQRALERERARIARDIHDELGASLTRITLLSQSARSEVPDHQPAAEDIDEIYNNARELTRAMDEIVWAVNPKHDTFDSLVTYLGRFAQHFLSAAGIRCRLDVPVSLPAWAVTAEIRHNLFLAFKEALHNVVKHARATEVRVSLELRPDGFVLVVADNGAGFDANPIKAPAAGSADGVRLDTGNGLLNMQKRLEEVGGHCAGTPPPVKAPASASPSSPPHELHPLILQEPSIRPGRDKFHPVPDRKSCFSPVLVHATAPPRRFPHSTLDHSGTSSKHMTAKVWQMSYKRTMAIAVSIVEDDSQARKIFAGWIHHASGFRLAGEWGDAESALLHLPKGQPNVVLMDINLPGISGIEAVRKLKPDLPETQFVMLTVYEDADHIYDALTAGATGYLLKQTPRRDLLNSIEEVYRGGSPMTSNIARKVVQCFRQPHHNGSESERLSPREQEVLDLLARGYLYKEIADRLNISVPTVNTYVRRMYEKLHVRSRAQAVAKYAHLAEAQRPASAPRS